MSLLFAVKTRGRVTTLASVEKYSLDIGEIVQKWREYKATKAPGEIPPLKSMKFQALLLNKKKKMIILQKETEEHRDAWTSAPQGEPGTPPSVLTPHSPSTIKRAAGVGTLYWDTIYASAAETYVTTPFCTGRGGSSLPPGWGRVLGQGRPRPPPSHARAATLDGGRGVGRGPPSTPPPYGGHLVYAV